MDFQTFKREIGAQFAHMRQHTLFTTKGDPRLLWTTYLKSFPDSTNPLYRERTEHDCSACRHFIRTLGGVVAVIDGKRVTLWDGMVTDARYKQVSQSMATFVQSRPIDNLFLSDQSTVGVEKNFEETINGVKTWEHFCVRLTTTACCHRREIGPTQSEALATHDVLARGLAEISLDAIDTVLELISQNSLYRGEEHQPALTAFRTLKVAYRSVAPVTLDDWLWMTACSTQSQAVLRIRNTAIGTLLTDISGDEDLEHTVRKFEALVAPQNYQRPTALVTKTMVDAAKQTIEELGLTSALERRYATLRDITANNILFASRATRKTMGKDIFDAVPTKADSRRFEKVEQLTIEKFLTDVLPGCQSVEVMVEPRHTNNLVSLMTATDPTAMRLFKWGNPFSWSYNGNVADSLKERVKKAGGNVTGDLSCRLAWHNYDDLDLHMEEPTGTHIYYRYKVSQSTGGALDVDMNAGRGTTREPVENIVYGTRRRMQEGTYQLKVHNFNKRESENVGFEVEIDYLGAIQSFHYDKPVRDGEYIHVAKLTYSHKEGLTITDSLPATHSSKTVWNITLLDFNAVNVVMLSPNHWDGQGVGNRHYFFMVEGCQQDGQARGFYNEFLQPELLPHRKVLELVGNTMKVEASMEQLSGVGFSSTQRNDVLVRLKGKVSRVVRVTF